MFFFWYACYLLKPFPVRGVDDKDHPVATLKVMPKRNNNKKWKNGNDSLSPTSPSVVSSLVSMRVAVLNATKSERARRGIKFSFCIDLFI